MGFPTTLKLFNVLIDTVSTQGVAKECKIPDFKRKFEEYRAGGFDTPAFIDVGGEALTCETTLAGMYLDALKTFGTAIHNKSMLHYMGAYENQETGKTDSVEVIMRGRHTFDIPNGKTGEIGDTKMKTHISYFKMLQNGVIRVEIDVTKAVFVVDGVDRLAEARAAAGL